MKKSQKFLILLALSSFMLTKTSKAMSNVQEIWKDIPGFEGFYQASYSGKIRSIDRIIISKDKIHKERHTFRKGIVLKTSVNRIGYVMCYPSMGGPKNRIKKYCCTVHSLVGLAWIPNPNNLTEINHIDGNKENNSVSNLERCTRGENMRHAHANGLVKFKLRGESPEAKRVFQLSLSGDFISEYPCVMDAQDATGVGFRQISAVALGHRKTVHGLRFTYTDPRP